MTLEPRQRIGVELLIQRLNLEQDLLTPPEHPKAEVNHFF